VRAGLHDDLSVEGDSEARDFQAFCVREDLAQESFIRLQNEFARLENPGRSSTTNIRASRCQRSSLPTPANSPVGQGCRSRCSSHEISGLDLDLELS